MNDKENLKVAVIESCINGTMTIKVAQESLKYSQQKSQVFNTLVIKYLTLLV